MSTRFVMHDTFYEPETRICFISSRSGFVIDDLNLRMDWANGRLIALLAHEYTNRFSVAIFGDSVQRKNHDFEISVRKVYSFPFPFSYLGGLLNFIKILRLLKKIERENDVLIIQLPFAGFASLLFIRKPTVYHLCANVLTAAANPFKYSGLRLVISKSFAWAMHLTFKTLLKRKETLLITNGEELGHIYRQYLPRTTVSSSIYEKEIMQESQVSQRSEGEEFRLLFVGRPSKEKGFHTLMEAFAALVSKKYNVSLFLLGIRKEELVQLVGYRVEDDLLRRVTFQDFISWGDRFKKIVTSSHALALCSVSEGTPRVLIEARALGCPVVATRVGGIPSSVTHEVDGLLFEAEDARGLEHAVVKLYDENFRQLLSRNGLRTVKNYTLEKFSNTFANALTELRKKHEG